MEILERKKTNCNISIPRHKAKVIARYALLTLSITAFMDFQPKLSAQNQTMNSETKTVNKPEWATSQNNKTFALRLKPGQDLRNEIEKFAKEHNIMAGYIITAAGSLKAASIRLADQNKPAAYDGKYEIVSLTGTISADGVHLHISISDKNGITTGGHLVEGCIIYTTAEIVIGSMEDAVFTREQDEQTGYKELKIKQK